MEWENVPREEQESIINIDYCERIIAVYTSRKSVGERLIRKIGEPTKIYKNQNQQIYAVEYKRNLADKDVSKFFSKLLMIGTFKNEIK